MVAGGRFVNKLNNDGDANRNDNDNNNASSQWRGRGDLPYLPETNVQVHKSVRKVKGTCFLSDSLSGSAPE